MKKIFALALVAVMLLAVLAGCAPKTLSGTFTITYTKEDITSNTFHNGFVTALGANGVNTIVFNEDGTYVYTKELHTEDENGAVIDPNVNPMSILITYTYYGTYTRDGEKAVLNFPTKCDFSENWGALSSPEVAMLKNTSGSYTFENGTGSGDIVQCKEEESHVPVDIFVGPYVLDSLTTSEEGFDASKCTVTVTLDQEAGTFTYVIINTDDE